MTLPKPKTQVSGNLTVTINQHSLIFNHVSGPYRILFGLDSIFSVCQNTETFGQA